MFKLLYLCNDKIITRKTYLNEPRRDNMFFKKQGGFKMKNKKLKKYLTTCIALAMLLSTLSITAFADTATRIEAGPHLKLHKWVATDTYSLTPGGGHPQGSKCYIFFENLGSLPSVCAAYDQRGMEVFLMEDDVFDDDTVKYYTGDFSGRKLTKMGYAGTTTSGEIEPGDTAEMYLDTKVYKRPSGTDAEEGYAIGKMFDFQIGINS